MRLLFFGLLFKKDSNNAYGPGQLTNSRNSGEDSLHTAGFLLMVVWFTCVIFSHVSTPQATMDVHKRGLLLGNNPPVEGHLWNSERKDYADYGYNEASCPQENFAEKVVSTPPPPPEAKTRSGTKRRRTSSVSQSSSSFSPALESLSNSCPEKNTRGKRSRVAKESESHAVPATNFPTAPVCSPYITKWNSNTTYLMCSTVSQITPPSNAFVENASGNTGGNFGEESSVPLIAFFIPPDCMAGTTGEISQSPTSSYDYSYSENGYPTPPGIPGHMSGIPGQVLQVTCQVVGLDFIPASHS